MAKPGITKVLIIDNQPLFSLGLSTVLESSGRFNIAAAAENGEDALKAINKEKPKLIIMEIRLNKENGMDLIAKLKASNPEISILVLSCYEERYYSERVLRLGARGFVMKSESSAVIMEAIQTVLEGKVYLSENERERIFQAMTGDNKHANKDMSAFFHSLSNRELQVFSLIGKGLGTIEIATRLNLSTKTVDTHKEHIKLKLHCSTSQELRQQAIEWTNLSGN